MTCGWCDRVILGRHRMADPYGWRAWAGWAEPALLIVPLIFHRRCWAAVKAIAASAESYGGELPADPPLTYCDHCGGDTYPATDHYCAEVVG